MRRLIVEISGQDIGELIPENLQDVKSAETLHFLRFDRQEVALIARVEFNKPNVRIEDVLSDHLIEAQLLEQEEETGICTYFIKAKLSRAINGEPDLTTAGMYFSLPYEVKDGKIKITSFGNAKQVRDFIKLLEDIGSYAIPLKRQREVKSRTFPQLRLHPNPPAVPLYNLLTER